MTIWLSRLMIQSIQPPNQTAQAARHMVLRDVPTATTRPTDRATGAPTKRHADVAAEMVGAGEPVQFAVQYEGRLNIGTRFKREASHHQPVRPFKTLSGLAGSANNPFSG